ncbi:PREDICTED: ATP-binding cassette sub-family B member 8, mitochondrial-like [Priapulus caudatus]|uniref:Mitochondrial potassium channel ATP-binding subunit n=1 Tax=Priapulus caudatus TaxID=37621 RepID=A0ABM1E591_PRICU|nr:PREDICTED: ATP-binding cassette sub-family B member 8, mitochondrial-like [Priapulus caudatus]
MAAPIRYSSFSKLFHSFRVCQTLKPTTVSSYSSTKCARYFVTSGLYRRAGNVILPHFRQCFQTASKFSVAVRNATRRIGRAKEFAKGGTRTNDYMKISYGFWIGTSTCAIVFFRLSNANCASKLTRTRFIETDKNPTEPKFQWLTFLKLLLPEIWFLVCAILSAFAVAIVNIKIPLLLGDLVGVISKYTAENAHNYLAEISKPATRLLAMYGIQGLLTFFYITLLSHVGEKFAARLRNQLFSKLLHQDMAFFDTHKTGEMVNRLTSDIQELKSAFKMCISQGMRSLTQTIGCVASLYIISPKMTALMVIFVPAIIITGTLIGSVLRKLSRQAQAQIARSTAVADEALGNIRTVRAFAMENSEIAIFQREVDESRWMNEKLGIGIAVFQSMSNIALNMIVLGTIYVGGHLLSKNELSAGDMMSFLVATQTIQRSLAAMSLLFGTAVRGVTAGARIFEYMSSEPTIPVTGGRTIPYHSLFGDVRFNDVTFRYPGRPEQVILDKFSIHLEKGKTLALCGLSGGGKSTVAALLERFYEVEDGSITVDNVDVRELNPGWLRGRLIGFISQEPVLFATSVMENIRYGRPEASDQEVYEAAKLANADDFIRNFPDGYSTVLGERGVTVSGGQKQRIAIARALIKKPSVIILDEATSALDAESERLVQEALDRITAGRTVLIIAHRLSTIQNADMIAVLADGVVAEKGTHTELKRKKGLYWQLIRHQQETEQLEEQLHIKHRHTGHH